MVTNVILLTLLQSMAIYAGLMQMMKQKPYTLYKSHPDCIEIAEDVDDDDCGMGEWKYCVVGCREEFDYKESLKENEDHYQLWPIRCNLLECIEDYSEENEGLSVKTCVKDSGFGSGIDVDDDSGEEEVAEDETEGMV